jgi:group I intron endonuclease
MRRIYCVVNLVNYKKYVGQTTNTLLGRWREHIQHACRGHHGPLSNAIRRYGIMSFVVVCLTTCETLTEANVLEPEWIKRLESHVSEWGYNCTRTGSHEYRALSKSARENMSSAQKLRYQRPGERELHGAKLHEYYSTEEGRQATKARRTREWEDPSYRARQVATRSGKKGRCGKCGGLGHYRSTCTA